MDTADRWDDELDALVRVFEQGEGAEWLFRVLLCGLVAREVAEDGIDEYEREQAP